MLDNFTQGKELDKFSTGEMSIKHYLNYFSLTKDK